MDLVRRRWDSPDDSICVQFEFVSRSRSAHAQLHEFAYFASSIYVVGDNKKAIEKWKISRLRQHTVGLCDVIECTNSDELIPYKRSVFKLKFRVSVLFM